ncbi:hypothetical protein EJ06DRAFT_139318 [Trichodelitschia bisporula]|uniref:Uncharacterized protein n=1 Tax=Trichodelitschia bisporula TaxID=703511 RepID=A0A6G1HPF6_9PEZI|nr:hypothetical protein EJ06DRAFT_139318 [Trichodelitschia bisporula]
MGRQMKDWRILRTQTVPLTEIQVFKLRSLRQCGHPRHHWMDGATRCVSGYLPRLLSSSYDVLVLVPSIPSREHLSVTGENGKHRAYIDYRSILTSHGSKLAFVKSLCSRSTPSASMQARTFVLAENKAETRRSFLVRWKADYKRLRQPHYNLGPCVLLVQLFHTANPKCPDPASCFQLSV